MTSLAPIPAQTQKYLDSIYDIDMESSINQIYESTDMCRAQIDILKGLMSNGCPHADKFPAITTALKTLESHIESIQEDLDSFKFEFIGGTI